MSDVSVFELFARLVVALALVLGLMAGGARLLRKRGIDLSGMSRGQGPRRQTVDVLARRVLSKNASVAVVRAGGRTLVLGVTNERVNLLAEAAPDSDDPLVVEEAHWTELPRPVGVGAQGGSPWKMALESLRERTVRRD